MAWGKEKNCWNGSMKTFLSWTAIWSFCLNTYHQKFAMVSISKLLIFSLAFRSTKSHSTHLNPPYINYNPLTIIPTYTSINRSRAKLQSVFKLLKPIIVQNKLFSIVFHFFFIILFFHVLNEHYGFTCANSLAAWSPFEIDFPCNL